MSFRQGVGGGGGGGFYPLPLNEPPKKAIQIKVKQKYTCSNICDMLK